MTIALRASVLFSPANAGGHVERNGAGDVADLDLTPPQQGQQ
ncbi:hypothetical protein AB0I85_27445 [Micromonospora echinofusca]